MVRGLYDTDQSRSSSTTKLARESSSTSLMDQSPYDPTGRSVSISSFTEKYSLAADPSQWGVSVGASHTEPDDYIHNPDSKKDQTIDGGGSVFTWRGLTNLGFIVLLALGLLTLFAGYPVITHFTKRSQSFNGGFNLGGMNSSGQVPDLLGNWGLIDKDTPDDALTTASFHKAGEEWDLIFSDEFNQDGRSFYPGDDPYWEAADLHYWGTNNLEWYTPEALTTKDGALEITLTDKPTRGMDYQGGMMSTWNKFCFTGGLILTSVTLPGANNIVGLWPAVWTMGNLGRAGYGATLDGTWPYSFDECDVGTVANQTVNGLPIAATINGDPSVGYALSFLPGQRLSRCTCLGESHPGPIHADGTYVGRSAPEIDIIEAQVVDTDTEIHGEVSQSSQWAPFNAGYHWINTSDTYSIADDTVSKLNTYQGAAFQQATSVVSRTNPDCYELETGCLSIYGFEYKPGFDDAYITWINDGNVSWTLLAGATAADTAVEIGRRPIPQEPMYIIVNLGMSYNFGAVDLEHITFPTKMRVDWIRVYQDPNALNIGCDPKDFPTQAYIDEYIEAYTNPNLTTWVDDYKQPIPKNRFLGEC